MSDVLHTMLSEQAPAVSALGALVEMFGHLPAAFVTLSPATGVLTLTVTTLDGFEPWRTALQVPDANVEWHPYISGSWLAARTVMHGVALELVAVVEVLPDAAEIRDDVPAAAVQDWNARLRVGTPVVAYPGTRDGECLTTTTRTAAWVLSGHTAVVMVEGHAACIAPTHVDVIAETAGAS